MRWRFNGDTCCACGGSTFNCCVGSITTHRDVNYIDSLIVRRQKTDLTWESREAVITPMELFATSITHPTSGQAWQYPCAASNCKWDAPSGTVTEYGTGEWDQSFEFGSYDNLLGEWAWKFNRNDNASLFGAFDLRLPLNNLPQQCNPAEPMIFKAGQPNDPDYWRKVEPPAMDAYLAQTTWDIQMGNTPLWDTWGSITFRFPHLTNFCWPSRGSTSGITYCNFANTTFTAGVYFDGSSGVNQSGTQSWSYDATSQDQYLEIPFGGNTLQFRPSTVTGEDDILYMHINGGFFFAEKFSVSGTCDGNITWTSLNNPSHYVTFTLVNGETCNECGENTPVVTGCCTLADGTVDPNSNATACAALGGTYAGDGSVCPPTGCCTLPDTSVESDVTEAYCTAQSGSWVSGDCPAIPTGCCAIVGSPDQPNKTEAECTALGGTWTEGANCDGTGWCIDDTDGSVTSGVEENDCTGTWSATEPTMGCCDVSGTQNPDVAQQWCTTQGGTFNAGDCVGPTFDPTTSARLKVNDITLLGPSDGNCGLDFTYLEFDFTPAPQTGFYTTNGTKQLTAMQGNVLGDNVFASSSGTATNAFSRTSVVFTTSSTYRVEAEVAWTYNGTDYRLLAQTDLLSTVGTGGCPSFTLSGSFTNFFDINNNWVQGCDGSTVADLIGSYNVTVECQ